MKALLALALLLGASAAHAGDVSGMKCKLEVFNAVSGQNDVYELQDNKISATPGFFFNDQKGLLASVYTSTASPILSMSMNINGQVLLTFVPLKSETAYTPYLSYVEKGTDLAYSLTCAR